MYKCCVTYLQQRETVAQYKIQCSRVHPCPSPLLRGRGWRRRRSAAVFGAVWKTLELNHNSGYVSRVTLPHNQNDTVQMLCYLLTHWMAKFYYSYEDDPCDRNAPLETVRWWSGGIAFDDKFYWWYYTIVTTHAWPRCSVDTDLAIPHRAGQQQHLAIPHLAIPHLAIPHLAIPHSCMAAMQCRHGPCHPPPCRSTTSPCHPPPCHPRRWGMARWGMAPCHSSPCHSSPCHSSPCHCPWCRNMTSHLLGSDDEFEPYFNELNNLLETFPMDCFDFLNFPRSIDGV